MEVSMLQRIHNPESDSHGAHNRKVSRFSSCVIVFAGRSVKNLRLGPQIV